VTDGTCDRDDFPPGASRPPARGLVVGRFQSFHLRYRHFIQYIDERVDRVIVGVGSADRSYSILSLSSFGSPSKVYSAELSFGS
jgi:nicotinamide mononucleotide adenylyltransferase